MPQLLSSLNVTGSNMRRLDPDARHDALNVRHTGAKAGRGGSHPRRVDRTGAKMGFKAVILFSGATPCSGGAL